MCDTVALMTNQPEQQSPTESSARRTRAALLAALSLGWLSACSPHDDDPEGMSRAVDAGAGAPVAADGATSTMAPREPTARPAPAAPTMPTAPTVPAVPTTPSAPTAPVVPGMTDAATPMAPPSTPAASDAGALDAATASAAPALPISEVRAQIVGHRAEGTLCPSDTTSWLLEPGADAFTVQLGGELGVSGSDGTASLSGACTLTFDLELPAGLRIGNPDLALMLAAAGPAELTTRYTFVGGDTIAEHTRTLADDSTFSERGDAFWSAPCVDPRARQRAQLVVELRGKVPADGYLGAFSVVSSFSYDGGSEFRTCAGEPVLPPAAGLDGRCSSYPKYQCAPGLTCDVLDDRTNIARTLHEGTCVDAKVPVSARPLDAPCGGARNVACEEGLVCHYGSAERAALRPVGICAKVAPASGERCGGSPLLVCESGLYCGTLSRASDAMYCQEGGGKQGARCGEALAACASGLTCNGEVCTPKLAGRGERCGEGVAACGHLDVCSERAQRCVENPDAGSLGTRCIADDECDRGLSCIQATCSERSTGEQDSACQVPNDCLAGLTCRANVCSP